MIRNINRLITKLQSPDPSVRRQAADGLSEGDARGIYPLIKALSDENTGVQDAAMRALIAIGGETVAYMALPLLREGSYLRNTGLIIMRQLGAVSVPLLYPLLRDKDHDLRKFAIDLLSEIQTNADASKIVPMLDDENANVRAAAAKALGDLRYRAAIPHLTRRLIDEEWVLFYALQSLGELGAVEAIPAIASLLASDSEAVRFSAIETLGTLGATAALPALVSYLPKATEDEKLSVVKSIVQIGVTPDMTDLPEHIIRLFETGDWEEKMIAMQGISQMKSAEALQLLVETAGSLDPDDPDTDEKLWSVKKCILAIDAEDGLINLLNSSDLKFRGKCFVIGILGEIGSKKAAVNLAVYLNDVSRDLRRASAEALGKIGVSDPVEELMETALKDPDAHVRKSAIEALGLIGSRQAFTVLKGLLDVENYNDIIEKLVEALIRIDSESFIADMSGYGANIRQIIASSVHDIDILKSLAADSDPGVVAEAIGGLGRLRSESAVETIIPFLGNRNADVRKAAVIALGDAHICSAELLTSLEDGDPGVRFYAVKVVVSCLAGEEAIERIKHLVNDEYIPVAISVIDSIREIGGREAFEALIQYEDHPNPDVREKISEALATL
jgi:HEAT repeat protein